MTDHTPKRKYKEDSPGPKTISQVRSTNIDAGRDSGNVKGAFDKIDPPSSKKSKTESRPEMSSTALSTKHEVNAGTKLIPLLPEWGINVVSFPLNFVEVGGYLNLSYVGQIGKLWEICQEPIWCYYGHCKTELGPRTQDFDTMLKVLDQGLAVKSTDITSTFEPDFKKFTEAHGTENWYITVFGRLVHQVLVALAEYRKRNKFPNVFSGAGADNDTVIVAKDTLRWPTEDVFRVRMMWLLWMKEIVGSRGLASFSSVQAMKGQVKPPIFCKKRPASNDTAPVSSSKSPLEAMVSVPQSTNPAITTSTGSSNGANVAHEGRLLDSVTRSLRGTSVNPKAKTGPDEGHNSAITTPMHGHHLPGGTTQITPHLSNTSGPASTQDGREALHNTLLKDPNLAFVNVYLQNKIKQVGEQLAMTQERIQDTEGIDEKQTRLLEKERAEVLKKEKAELLKSENVKLTERLAELLEDAKQAKAKLDAKEESVSGKKLEIARLRKERLAGI
ncbi:hypothetical protein LTR56_025192 [Elasticomyces elasticus]|nr:hypothetical protein LTR56_025192 [Elasticomyces elasticus]KAK3649257.1 hypothetical protein LTR22_012986 [Elasticomyces elasticus]KAK4928209.1 hypothetical protein LTR49_005147 [Elasticomyces elasticus]KAK5765963.1 hypothetical protein LTS12_003970 [Elasticomyces elasticus]